MMLLDAILNQNKEPDFQFDPRESEFVNPLFFLVLHATELALKSVGLARGIQQEFSHDIVKILKKNIRLEDRSAFRDALRDTRELIESRIRKKWSRNGGALSNAAKMIELEGLAGRRVGLVSAFRTLGALGQSSMTKIEFGEEQSRWWHGARYPRKGVTSYPDFDVCVIICENILKVATRECTK